MKRFPLHDEIERGGDLAAIEAVLSAKGTAAPFSPHDLDLQGHAPVHYLAVSEICKDEVQKLDLLLAYYKREGGYEKEVVMNVLTKHYGNTVLHLACLFKKQQLARRLMELGADRLIGNGEGWAAVHFAAATLQHRSIRLPVSAYYTPHTRREDSVTQVELLLDTIHYCDYLIEYQYAPHVRTPVQVAARALNLDALKLFWEYGFDFRPHRGQSLFELIIDSDDLQPAVACAEFLLDNNVEGLGGSHPVILASCRQAPRLLRSILEHRRSSELLVDPWLDELGVGPLHHLAAFNEPAALHCADLLLDKKYHHNHAQNLARFVRQKDTHGRSAVEICCQQKNVELAKKILMATYRDDPSTDLSKHYWLAAHVLDRLYQRIPVALIPVLDMSWKTQLAASRQRADYRFDYTCITGVITRNHRIVGGSPSQRPPVYNLVRKGKRVQKKVLLHLLILQYLKHHWTKETRAFAYASAVSQFLVLAIYIFVISSCNCIYNFDSGEEQCCGMASLTIALITVALQVAKEAYQLVTLGLRFYTQSVYNIFQMLFGVTAIISIALTLSGSGSGLIWLPSIIGILLAWVVTILQLRNLPQFGLYISILIQVTWKSFKILALIGLPTFAIFAQIFQILLRKGPFQSAGPVGVPVKLMSMMIGELTFDDMVKQLDQGSARYFVVLLVFTLFAFVATIVLLNYLVAMAVNITYKVESNAKTEVARCQLEQICLWETFIPKFKWFTEWRTHGSRVKPVGGAPAPKAGGPATSRSENSV